MSPWILLCRCHLFFFLGGVEKTCYCLIIGFLIGRLPIGHRVYVSSLPLDAVRSADYAVARCPERLTYHQIFLYRPNNSIFSHQPLWRPPLWTVGPVGPIVHGHVMRCGTISSCQSAATSEIVKHCWSRVLLM